MGSILYDSFWWSGLRRCRASRDKACADLFRADWEKRGATLDGGCARVTRRSLVDDDDLVRFSGGGTTF